MRLWKSFRTNMMYWRFRYITRNRLRLQSWYNRRRQPTTATYRPRAAATFVYRRSGRRTWMAVLAMVVLLTAVRVAGHYTTISGTVSYLVSTLIIIGCIYWALRGV
jgi:hypothetical protein